MARKPPPPAVDKPRAKRGPAATETHFLVELVDWEFRFGCMVHHWQPRKPDFRHDPLYVSRDVDLKGLLLSPARVKRDAVEVALAPSSRLNFGAVHGGWGRDDFGQVSLARRSLQVRLFFPADVLAPLVQALSVRSFRFLTFACADWNGRAGAVRSYHFCRTFYRDDYPDAADHDGAADG